MQIIFSKCAAEFLGSLAIVLFGCGSIAVAVTFETSTLAFVPLIFGLTVGMMVYAVGHISGAHFNPAVSFAFAVAKRFPWKQVPAYWSAQVLGGIAGCGLILLMVPGTETFGATIPAVPSLAAVITEAALTFFLMLVITSVATDARAVGVMAGAAIGTAVTVDAFLGGALTGASMNPARSIAPAIFEGHLDTLWIYILAPMGGAAAGALCYELIRCDTDSII